MQDASLKDLMRKQSDDVTKIFQSIKISVTPQPISDAFEIDKKTRCTFTPFSGF